MGEKENIEKFTLWERSTRVPLIISAPGMTKPGSRCDQPVSLMDLYPTLVELAGLKPPPHLDGHSLVPQIKDPATITSPVVSSYMFSWADRKVIGHAVRSLRYRYIYYPEINLEELYDHQIDPNEWNNIAYKNENKSIIDQLRAELSKLLPQQKWPKEGPEGYTIDAEGNLHRDHYIKLTDLPDRN
jgi:arylsulfatase A-like enzyme